MKMMKQLCAFAAVLMVAFTTLSFTAPYDDSKTRKGKGESTIIQHQINTGQFETIKVSGNFKVILTEDQSQKVTIEAPAEAIEVVKNFTVNNELNVYTQGAYDKKITIRISLADIHNISTFGNVRIIKK